MGQRTPQQQRGIARRNALLDAAAASFAARGYGAAPLSEIARDAGGTLGGLVFYFPHKDDLARAVLAEQHERTEHALAGAFKQDSPIADAIRGSSVLADLLRSDPMVRASVRLCAEEVDFHDAETALQRTWTVRLGAHFAQAAAAGQLRAPYEPEALARFVSAAFFGVCASSAGADQDTALGMLWELILDGAFEADRSDRLHRLVRDVFPPPQPPQAD